MQNLSFKVLSFYTIIFLSFFCNKSLNAQCTPGIITVAHTSSIYDALLDPDGNGYISDNGDPFSSGTTEMAEFEPIPNSTTGWNAIQDVSEVDSDITPNCGNPDLIQDDDGGDFAFYNIIDPTPGTPSNGDEYILFRFRLAKSPNGNFGYNFLVDTDAAYGSVDDGNSTCGNMGFEREVQFANAGGKKGVSVYDVDGSVSFNSTLCNQCISISDVQEACAASSGGCATTDPQFITFPLPLSYIGVPSNVATTDFYIAAATASSGNATSVLGGGNVTDLGALDGGNTGCACTGLSGCALFDCQTDCINTAFTALPVELLYFSAIRKQENAELKWATISERNNSHFVLEHSIDGFNFSTLKIIEGAGDSFETIEYNYVHQTPISQVNYYRLKQIDYNGRYALSAVEVINALNIEKKISLYPNVASNYIHLALNEIHSAEIQGTIFNSMGEKMTDLSFKAGEGSLELDIAQYQTGHYFIKIKLDNTMLIKRFLKSN